ncbi:MAG: hypothetical protein V7K64_13705 [Nostoc sp.]|nr:hypothetical protein [Nostoc sp. JL34]
MEWDVVALGDASQFNVLIPLPLTGMETNNFGILVLTGMKTK